MSKLNTLFKLLRTSFYTFGCYHRKLRSSDIVLYIRRDEELSRRMEAELRENPAYRGYRVMVVRDETARSAWRMGTSKYVIACGALPDWYAKREGQTLVCIGSAPEARGCEMGGIQRSYLNADYVICSDEAMRNAIADTYFLDGLYRGKYLFGDDAKQLCARVLLGKGECRESAAPVGEKERVLILSGSLKKNGLTASLLNLLASLDMERRDYYISFYGKDVAEDPSRLEQLPEGVRYIPIPHMRQESFCEKLATLLYLRRDCTRPWVMRLVNRYFERLYRRSFGGCDFDWVIDHCGYNKYILNMLPVVDAKRAVFVHNDMLREIATRQIQHLPTLKRVYRACDRVAAVTQDIVESTVELSGRSDNVVVVNNCHDWREVQRRGEEPLRLDPDTRSNVSEEALAKLLAGDSIKLITIGRYSPEKGHAQLLEAFERFHRETPNSSLILIGGHGVLYEETVRRAAQLDCSDRVAVICSMKNPMPVLKRCDLFVLSSLYEGLGLVLLEADTLGVPVISTDVCGPRGFLREHGGTLVPPNAEGLYQGMRDFMNGKIKPMNVDYDAHNRRAVSQFEALFD